MKDKKDLSMAMTIGMAIGAGIGVALDNIGAWIAIGLAFGAGIGSRMSSGKKNDAEN